VRPGEEPRRARRAAVAAVLGVGIALGVAGVPALAPPRTAEAQDLGHKVLGTLGLRAGAAPVPGVAVVDKLLLYSAGTLVDGRGRTVPVPFDLDVFANLVGVQGAVRVPLLRATYAATIGVPVARVRGTFGGAGGGGGGDGPRPEVNLDKLGLADVFVEPLRLGWTPGRAEIVVGYAFYAPRTEFQPGPRGSVSRGQWTHQFSLGSTLYADGARTWHLSALASYEWNGKKLGADITRGDDLQIQGGVGKTIARIVDVGLVGYAQWQVRDNSGAALPEGLRALRDRTCGVGGEVAVGIPWIRGGVRARYAADVAVRARPRGSIVIVELLLKPF